MKNEQPRQEREILNEAAKVFTVHDELATALRVSEEHLETLCSEYGLVTRRWGYAPHHLRNAAKASGLLS
jgi:RNA polymerase-interacting CarD/CdnL/TRCF family regulator